jgi:LPXTG-motif cell wall-anchored protein
LTQASSSKGTPLPGTEATIDPNATIVAQPSALPNTGFADEVGLPGLVGLTIILLAVILFTRRARAARSG